MVLEGSFVFSIKLIKSVVSLRYEGCICALKPGPSCLEPG